MGRDVKRTNSENIKLFERRYKTVRIYQLGLDRVCGGKWSPLALLDKYSLKGRFRISATVNALEATVTEMVGRWQTMSLGESTAPQKAD
jgi:hypothetical protein